MRDHLYGGISITLWNYQKIKNSGQMQTSLYTDRPYSCIKSKFGLKEDLKVQTPSLTSKKHLVALLHVAGRADQGECVHLLVTQS